MFHLVLFVSAQTAALSNIKKGFMLCVLATARIKEFIIASVLNESSMRGFVIKRKT